MISKEHYTIDFYLSLVVLSLASYNLPRFIYFIINKKNNFLSKILYYDISDKLIDVLTLITIIAFISYIFLNRYLPFFKKILKTPMKYYYSLHGVTYGIILGLLTWIIINFCVFQMVWFFEGDFIIIGILIGVLLFSIQKIYYSIIQNKIIKNENPDIFQEIPILTKNDDKLEHSKVVDEIKSILFDPDDEYGKTIALYGRNGSGKTSVINLLKESLLGKKNIIFVDFEPFKYKNQSEISKSFYESIKSLINKDCFLPGVWGLSDKYYDLFTGVASSPILGFINIGKMFEFFKQKETFDDLQIVVSKYLSNFNIKCVVVVDNIDRCTLKNRHLLFQLISTIGKTKNLFYLIAASEYEMLSVEAPQPVTIIE